MYAFRSLKTAFSTVALTCLMAAPALAGDEVPFKLTASATSITTPVYNGNHMTFTASGAGKASHMGHITFVAPHDFDLSNGTYVSDAFVSAANGDVLHLVTHAQFINALDSVGTWVADGGTGRFAHATGTGEAINLNFGADITFTGWISSVGSSK